MENFGPYTPSPNYDQRHYDSLSLQQDIDRLKMLSIGHYVLAVLAVLFSCLFIFYIVMGIIVMTGHIPVPAQPQNMRGPSPQDMKMFQQLGGMMMLLMGSVFLILGWSFAFCCYLSGRYIAVQKNRIFSVVIACAMCAISFPIGTVLGILTLIVLLKDPVVRLYEAKKANLRSS